MAGLEDETRRGPEKQILSGCWIKNPAELAVFRMGYYPNVLSVRPEPQGAVLPVLNRCLRDLAAKVHPNIYQELRAAVEQLGAALTVEEQAAAEEPELPYKDPWHASIALECLGRDVLLLMDRAISDIALRHWYDLGSALGQSIRVSIEGKARFQDTRRVVDLVESMQLDFLRSSKTFRALAQAKPCRYTAPPTPKKVHPRPRTARPRS